MNLALLTPWHQLLWLVCAVILIVSVVSAGITAVIREYFRAKEEHIGRIAMAVGKTLTKMQDELTNSVTNAVEKLKKKEKKEKTDGEV